MLVACTNCGKKTKLSDEFAGRQLKCPDCQTQFIAEAVPPPPEPGTTMGIPDYQLSPVVRASAHWLQFACKYADVYPPEPEEAKKLAFWIVLQWGLVGGMSVAVLFKVLEHYQYESFFTPTVFVLVPVLWYSIMTVNVYHSFQPVTVWQACKLSGIATGLTVLCVGGPIAVLVLFLLWLK